MEKNEHYRNFDNRTSFNGRPCRPDQELVPVVLDNEMEETLENAGLKKENEEKWTIGKTKIRVAFVPDIKGQKEAHMKEFNKAIKRCITKNIEDNSSDVSLDEIIKRVNDSEEKAWDPTGSTYYEDFHWGLLLVDMLIDDVATKNPVMGQIIRLLSEGYQKKEILEMVKLDKGKTQGYAFIEKAQSLAKEIYLNNYC